MVIPKIIRKVGYKLLSNNLQLKIRKSLSLHRLVRGDYNKEREMLILDRIVSPGAKVMDIGANLGYYTYPLTQIVGSNGKVISFEPIHEVNECLTYAKKKLAWDNTEIYKFALGSEEGSFDMVVPVDVNGREITGLSHLSGKFDEKNAIKYTVQVKCLDNLDIELDGLSFIKCDVEGAELNVFRGAINTIKKYHPLILVEIENRHLERYHLTSKDVFLFLHNIGYKSYYYDGAKLVDCQDCVYGFNNYFFIPEKHLNVLDAFADNKR